MEKYFFKENQNGSCLEPCNVKKNGTKIGSVTCQRCEYCTSKEDTGPYSGPTWIVCSRIEEAKGQIKKIGL